MAGPARSHVASYMMACVVVLFCVFGDANVVSRETIGIEDGVIFDCVDINSQPSLDHPALRNHKIYMEPASFPEGITAQPSSYIRMKSTGPVDRGCPYGRVPIRRSLRTENLLPARSVSNFMKNQYRRGGGNLDQGNDFINRFAVETMFGQAGGIYKGTLATMNVWNPKVTSEQGFSLAELLLSNGPFYENFIEAGWNVNPGLYGDNATHLFIRWTVDNYNNTGCYDLMCPGFVQVSNTVAPGMTLKKVSSYGGTQEIITLLVFWDEGSKSWWLAYRELDTDSYTWVGYWPGSIFTNLITTADTISWGGQAAGPWQNYPQMGSGHFPSEGFTKAAYMGKILYVDPDLVLRNAPRDLSIEETCRLGYKVEDGVRSPEVSRYFFYGGPGGQCLQPASEVNYPMDTPS